MFVKKFFGIVKKTFGRDTIESRWYEAPLYEYTLEKEVSEVTAEGHGWEWDEGEAVVYRLTDEGWARATVYPFDGGDEAMKAVFGGSEGFEDVESVSGVVDVHEEEIGRTEWDIEVDVASGTIVSVERETVRF